MFGQIWLPQFPATGGLASRSALASTALASTAFASTATSSAFTAGAKPGKAITAAPNSENIARAEMDLIIWDC